MPIDENFCNFGDPEQTTVMVITLILKGIRGSVDEGWKSSKTITFETKMHTSLEERH